MMTVIPGFLVHSEREFEERLQKFIGLTTLIHLDVMDGEFVPNTTWADAEAIACMMPESMRYELHLMVKDPLPYVAAHHGERVQRYVFHIESSIAPATMIAEARKWKKEVYFAINPSTPLARVTEYATAIDGILVMGNRPGFSGVAIDQEKTVERLRVITRDFPNLARSVDIGVNNVTAPALREAGATELVSTSYLTSTGDVAEAIQSLQ